METTKKSGAFDEVYEAPHCYVVETWDGRFEARAYRVRADDFNAIGIRVDTTQHRTKGAALKSAARMAREYGGTLAAE